ncbi:hypothetical protein A3744_32200 [Oleiphilus sp. HI0073]|nr:hypothetical protein A3744_32200 [Oleiphilus sp. HI0073]
MDKNIENVLHLWFEELEPRQHWVKDATLDENIAARFGALHDQAKNGALDSWRSTAKGRLAEIIILDQFSRNIYRDESESFACDPIARRLSIEAIQSGADKELSVDQRAFLYMPLMHSEGKEDHQLALKVFDQPGLENSLDFERRHWRIIERFGRYPHRNDLLGRVSSPEEQRFLTEPGSRF